jgi:hypothetical protein
LQIARDREDLFFYPGPKKSFGLAGAHSSGGKIHPVCDPIAEYVEKGCQPSPEIGQKIMKSIEKNQFPLYISQITILNYFMLIMLIINTLAVA